MPVGKQFAQRRDVPHRFRHFFLIHQQVLGVEPVAHKIGLAGGRFGFGNFIFVMRKGQIHAAAMNVERIAQIFQRHRRRTRCASRGAPVRWRSPRNARRA